jgi:hypothetical protein
MAKLIAFSVIAIIASVLVIGISNNYHRDDCKKDNGKIIVNRVGDVIGCIK